MYYMILYNIMCVNVFLESLPGGLDLEPHDHEW